MENRFPSSSDESSSENTSKNSKDTKGKIFQAIKLNSKYERKPLKVKQSSLEII
jgi:hypothetical protein